MLYKNNIYVYSRDYKLPTNIQAPPSTIIECLTFKTVVQLRDYIFSLSLTLHSHVVTSNFQIWGMSLLSSKNKCVLSWPFFFFLLAGRWRQLQHWPRTLRPKPHADDTEVPWKFWVLSLWFVLCGRKINYFA